MSTENLREGVGNPSTTVRPAMSLIAARLSFAAGVATLVLLAALHLLSPEFDPTWRMVSEYALGEYGWVLSLLFIAWALCTITLFLAVRSQIHSLSGKIGLGLLLLSALGTAMAAVFDFQHALHGLAALIGIPTFPLAAMLISRSLLRNPSWFSPSGRKALLWTANLTWISLVLMFATLFLGPAQTSAQSGLGAPIGWPNRLLVVAYCAWMMLVARRSSHLDQP